MMASVKQTTISYKGKQVLNSSPLESKLFVYEGFVVSGMVTFIYFRPLSPAHSPAWAEAPGLSGPTVGDTERPWP